LAIGAPSLQLSFFTTLTDLKRYHSRMSCAITSSLNRVKPNIDRVYMNINTIDLIDINKKMIFAEIVK
jgi:hypothetical protein